MTVFIAWSGETGQRLAEILKRWLEALLPEIHFFSASGLEMGMNWHSELRTAIEKADYGVLCMTRESLDSQWLAYEAGMLDQKNPPVPMISFLFGINQTEVRGPLRHILNVNPDLDGIRTLVDALWNAAKEQHVEVASVMGQQARLLMMSSAFQAELDELWENEKKRSGKMRTGRQEETIAEISSKLDAILSVLPAIAAKNTEFPAAGTEQSA